MPSPPTIIQQDDGWSDWIAPLMGRKPKSKDRYHYRMGCCDCNLVHDMDFKIVKVTGTKADGTFKYEDVPSGVRTGQYRLLLKARRNERSTTMGRKTKDKVDKIKALARRLTNKRG